MANWKKVIVSGSNAELNTVTASFFSGDGSALTNVPAGSLNIESFTDGTAITVATTDKLILSDAGTEKFIQVSQLPFTTANVSTDLSTTLSTTAIKINSSDGADVSIGAATTSAAGIMTKAIFDEHTDNNKKVSNVTTNLSITGTTGARTIVSSDGTNAIIPVATTLVSGVMSKAIFDEHVLNNAKVTNSHNNDVSVVLTDIPTIKCNEYKNDPTLNEELIMHSSRFNLTCLNFDNLNKNLTGIFGNYNRYIYLKIEN